MDCLLLLDGAAIPEELDDNTIPVVRVSPQVMKKLSGVESSESTEAAAAMRIPSTYHSIANEQKECKFHRRFPSLHRILVFDGIQVCEEYMNVHLTLLLHSCLKPFPQILKLSSSLMSKGVSICQHKRRLVSYSFLI